MYADANRSVLSRDLKASIVSADLVDGDREFQTVGAAIENDLSLSVYYQGAQCKYCRQCYCYLLLAPSQIALN